MHICANFARYFEWVSNGQVDPRRLSSSGCFLSSVQPRESSATARMSFDFDRLVLNLLCCLSTPRSSSTFRGHFGSSSSKTQQFSLRDPHDFYPVSRQSRASQRSEL